ncbi:transglycosylase-like protein with SLT domain [Anseongella ginsenosidimutans]|uniref:Transglycosylase-like protein with SLT domain n=1 Tax=Anseongella ginsenosidimutans TaxID=496056 RepID=A0A4R3KRF5_9SPHI|nr:lytic transglycosylase domain-containing protein [Anseongella ginsenosidimutans]QEC52305.1 lytic transglycosylase domain-containing protein [Anseongella ginsenosidimutans]TCS86865.1 transglycosylase-like protein with SLT domain [Anseongella ginsenosidimutans]
MIKRYLLSSVALLIILSFNKLFSYPEPGKAAGPEKERTARIAEKAPDVSRNELLTAEAAGFPVRLSFAGEPIPLENQRVFKKMDYALRKHYRQLALNKKLMEGNPRTMSVIDRILEKHKIPEDFRYLPVIESRLSRATSHKGAGGYWQFMPATARALGLVVNDEVDERNDLVKSTIAACKYLKTLYRELGSWTLAAAAYNIGQGKLQKELRRQDTGSYYFLDLNAETERYLYRLVAMKELLNNPSRYREVYGN